jgi:hypothetical protein
MRERIPCVYKHEWKRNLIERENLEWNDFVVGRGLDPLTMVTDATLDPGTGAGVTEDAG